MEATVNSDNTELPSYSETSSVNDLNQITITNQHKPFGSGLSINQIKTALIKYTTNNYLPSTKKIKEIKILNIEYNWSTIYNLHCYNEHRELCEVFTEYTEGRLQDASLGKQPDIWEIKAQSKPDLFQEHKEIIKVPYSENVKCCFKCKGKGRYVCQSCHGMSAQTVCYKCDQGKVTCKVCKGKGNLKYYLEIIIRFQNKIFEHISTNTKIPNEKLKKVEGIKIHESGCLNLPSINYPDDREITIASALSINKNKEDCESGNEKSIWQKHSITIIPIASIHYQYKNKIKTFYVYGTDLKIYAPSFPTDLPNCSIM